MTKGLYYTMGVMAALTLTFSCKKSPPLPDATVTIDITHEVDGTPLLMDTIRYTNAAGNPYSITRLEYYLSSFTFLHPDHEVTTAEIHYINGRTPDASISFTLPARAYTGIQFYIGLPANKNVSYTLPATQANVNMAWPESMGGGYHFMKLEGHFIDDQQVESGYAMHLGMNQWLVTVLLQQPLDLTGSNHPTLHLRMNINQWFTMPHTYDFNVQGNYTMGIDSLMGQLSANGVDVFTLTQTQ